ncbi:OST-HTH/LOTUS domain-containing protein [Aliiroseovarius crassostreae]|uniref:OST-HTH/LOTUS domain-containing protein n=1 Tax=Aliiroseovarius crassostreae TaxID=154981 RepID=UPI0022100325|nr:OST-HTH/LOTUS domain-containing protein [Aliiroseovarius crassostreae]UWQ10822.1 OST-HTH/LOTUS domain-containing protein [Aliiroseovarius crassostreae]
MTEVSDSSMKRLHSEVEQLLGRCLLHIQQYEQMLKTITVIHKISGPIQEIDELLTQRTADYSQKTLGTLIKNMFGSFIVSDEQDASNPTVSSSDTPKHFSIHTQLVLSDSDYEETEKALKDFVRLRNELVHNFIRQYNLESREGCTEALSALEETHSAIDHHYSQLQQWRMVQHQALDQIFQSPTFLDITLNRPPLDKVTKSLREAASELSVDGWAPLEDAGLWITKRHEDQTPANLDCRSWRHVVQEARVFEIRYFNRGGKRSAWYRERGAEHPKLQT